jgi:hypothetical protein
MRSVPPRGDVAERSLGTRNATSASIVTKEGPAGKEPERPEVTQKIPDYPTEKKEFL